MRKLATGALLLCACSYGRPRPLGWAELLDVRPKVSAVMVLHVEDGPWDRALHDKTCADEPVVTRSFDCGALFGCPPERDYRCRDYPGRWAFDDAMAKMAHICPGDWEVVHFRVVDGGGPPLAPVGRGHFEGSSLSIYIPVRETEMSFDCAPRGRAAREAAAPGAGPPGRSPPGSPRQAPPAGG